MLIPSLIINRITTRDARFQLKPGEGADAVRTCLELADITPYWIKEPTHPDDVIAHQTLARAIAPLKVAVGEHIPHLRDYFMHPALVADGLYQTPELPGCSADLREEIV